MGICLTEYGIKKHRCIGEGDRAWHLGTAPALCDSAVITFSRESSHLGGAAAAGMNPRERASF